MAININTKELAEKLNVNHKTIWNNINLLCDYGYICWCRSYKGLINVLILGYKEQKEKNGPGYIVVNDEWFQHILKCSDVNSLRIMIRETVNIDNQNTTGYFFNTKETSYCTDIIGKAYSSIGVDLNKDKLTTSVYDLLISDETYISYYWCKDNNGIMHIYYLV